MWDEIEGHIPYYQRGARELGNSGDTILNCELRLDLELSTVSLELSPDQRPVLQYDLSDLSVQPAGKYHRYHWTAGHIQL